jgi:hypothetical protein
MNQETTPTQPQPAPRTASAEKQALLEAYDTVLKHQAVTREAEQREAGARRAVRGRVRPWVWTSAAFTMVLCAYLLVERPEWLFPEAGTPETTEVQEASLRIGMANAAQHIQRFYQQNTRFPETLAEAGAHSDGIEYTRIGTGWRMKATQGGVELTLSSRDALANFIGRSFEVIARRTQ